MPSGPEFDGENHGDFHGDSWDNMVVSWVYQDRMIEWIPVVPHKAVAEVSE